MASTARAGETVASAPARFAAGDRVRVLAMYPLGHVRTPWYIRGKSGVVERLCGAYRNPEELAYHRGGLPAQLLYRVRFLQREVWPDYRGSATDTLDVEIYDHWLEPLERAAGRNDGQAERPQK